jgi:hypothetical protein
MCGDCCNGQSVDPLVVSPDAAVSPGRVTCEVEELERMAFTEKTCDPEA